MTLTLIYGKLSFDLPKEVDVSVEEIATIFSLRKEGLHLKCFREREWKNVYSTDGRFDVLPDIEKAYVIGIPHATDQDSTRLSCPVPPPPSLRISTSPSFPTLSLESSSASNAHTTSNFLRRGNACLNLGPKAVPPVKRQKTESKSYPCLRSVDVSEISKTGKLETVLEVKIDLSKLEKLYELFTVKEIQDEISFQMGITGTMIILYRNGTPVKDSPNTRGISFWNTKTQIPAIASEVYKHYKPSAYNLIKEDYGLYDENMFDDKLLNLFGNDDVFNSYHSAKNVEIGEDLAEKNVEEGKLLNDIKNLLNTKFEALKGELKNSTGDSKKVLEFQSLFRCIVWYSTTPNCYSACVFCGRYLGCYNCICRLDSCPVCRKSFKCSCSKTLPCNPMFILGIEDLLEIPSIRRNEVRENSRNDNDSLPSANTIPMALPEE